MTNELGDAIPGQIVKKAEELNCAGGVRYVYIEGEYDNDFPAASIGLKMARRFRSINYENYKQKLGTVNGIDYVAFESPSNATRTPLERVPVDQIPPLPDARIKKETNTYAIDDTPLNFIVEDGFIHELPHNPIKAYCIQLLKIDDGNNYNNHHYEIRFAYYMVGHKGRRRGKWQFGQFAPMMLLDEYHKIHETIQNRGWMTYLKPEIN